MTHATFTNISLAKVTLPSLCVIGLRNFSIQKGQYLKTVTQSSQWMNWISLCRENGSYHDQDPHLTLTYLLTTHVQCSQAHTCTHVGNELLLTITIQRALPSALCGGKGGNGLVTCRLARCGCDSGAWPATKRIKLNIRSFTLNIPLLLSSLTESSVNLPGAGKPLEQ